MAFPAGQSRLLRRSTGVVGVLLLAVVLALSAGSLSVGFLKDRVLSAARKHLPAGSAMDMADIRASLGAGTIIVDLHETRLDVPGRAEVSVASLRADIAMLPLLSGTVRPVAVHADGLTVDIAGRGQPAGPPEGSRMDLVRQAAASLTTALGRLETTLHGRGIDHITFSDVRLQVAGHEKGPMAGALPVMMERLDWNIGEAGSDIRITFAGDRGAWTFTADSTPAPENGRHIAFHVGAFPPSLVFPRLADAQLPSFDGLADLSGQIATAADGRFAESQFTLTFSPGRLALMPRHQADIDALEIAVDLPGGGDTIKIERAAFRSGPEQGSFTAVIDAGRFGDPVAVEARLHAGRLAGPADDGEPVHLDEGHARGRIDLAGGRIELQEAYLSGPDGAASLNGLFVAGGEQSGLSGTLHVEEATTRLVYALWPSFVARQARNWFKANVRTGLVGPGSLEIKLPKAFLGPEGRDKVLPADSLAGEIPFRFALFSPTPELPLVRRSSGFVRFGDAAMMAGLDQAEVTAAGFGSADVRQSYFRIPDLGKPGAVGYLDLRLAGPAPVLAQLSNSGPLGIATERGLEPKDLSGQGELSLFAEIPLGERIDRKSVHADFALKLSDFASAAPLSNGRRIAHANITVSGTTEAYTVKGDAVVDGIPAQIDLKSGVQGAPSTARLTLDEEAQRKLGIDLRPFVTGPMIALVDPAGGKSQRISLDLTPTDINLPFLGWHKLPAVSARFDARMSISETGTEIDSIRFTGEGFSASGNVSIDPDGRLVELSARNVRLRPDEHFAISAYRTGETLNVEVSGEAFDIRGLISAVQDPDSPASTSPNEVDLRIELERLIGHNAVEIADVEGHARFTGGAIESLSVRGGPDGVHTIDIAADPEAGEQKITARLGRAGEILRFLNVYRNAYGGGMALTFSGPRETGDGKGHVSLSGIRVRESGRDITVRRLGIPFSRKGQTIAIYNASMVADGLDAKAKGSINLESRYMSIRGTIVPTSGLNRLPAAMPILGDLLGAKKRKGLIGVAFTLAGPLSSPELKLNVASAVTPGIVKRIFGK